MAKKVVLSFDDGRLDTYTNAVPIMEKYGLKATINIATDFVLHPKSYHDFESASNKAMTVENVQELHRMGYEIASHGDKHVNDSNDLKTSIAILRGWGIGDVVGFASPFSEIDTENHIEIKKFLHDGNLQYIRTGLQVRKQGIFYTVLYIIEELIHSKYLYYQLNKRAIGGGKRLLYGISVSSCTTLEQMEYLIDRAPDETALIFIFHSILGKKDAGMGRDKWYWPEERFEGLCSYLAQSKSISVILLKDL